MSKPKLEKYLGDNAVQLFSGTQCRQIIVIADIKAGICKDKLTIQYQNVT